MSATFVRSRIAIQDTREYKMSYISPPINWKWTKSATMVFAVENVRWCYLLVVLGLLQASYVNSEGDMIVVYIL